MCAGPQPLSCSPTGLTSQLPTPSGSPAATPLFPPHAPHTTPIPSASQNFTTATSEDPPSSPVLPSPKFLWLPRPHTPHRRIPEENPRASPQRGRPILFPPSATRLACAHVRCCLHGGGHARRGDWDGALLPQREPRLQGLRPPASLPAPRRYGTSPRPRPHPSSAPCSVPVVSGRVVWRVSRIFIGVGEPLLWSGEG